MSVSLNRKMSIKFEYSSINICYILPSNSNTEYTCLKDLTLSFKVASVCTLLGIYVNYILPVSVSTTFYQVWGFTPATFKVRFHCPAFYSFGFCWFQYTELNNQQISLADYITRKYNFRTNDLRQPVLLSHPTRRDIRRGQTDNIALIPEHCFITGLSDEEHGNFKLMNVSKIVFLAFYFATLL